MSTIYTIEDYVNELSVFSEHAEALAKEAAEIAENPTEDAVNAFDEKLRAIRPSSQMSFWSFLTIDEIPSEGTADFFFYALSMYVSDFSR